MRRGFTLIELLVVIAIIAVLAAMLFPVMAHSREKARQSSCLSNLKQLGLGVLQYVQDFDERLPQTRFCPPDPGGGQTWAMVVLPYGNNTQIFECPSYPLRWRGSYTEEMAYGLTIMCEERCVPVAHIRQPAETVMLGDGTSMRLKPQGHSFDGYRATSLLATRHNGMGNVTFCDGHAKAMKRTALEITATSEGKFRLSGDEMFIYWNLY